MNAHVWIIGSGADCDLRVDAPTVSARHCRLTRRGDAYLLEDLESTNGTFIRDERLRGPRIVRRHELVMLGRNVPLPWPPAVDSITIGRASDNVVVIPMDVVSAYHARLDREGGGHFLTDLGSSNGTAVNEPTNKITRTRLRREDQVFFGTHQVSAAELIAAIPAVADDAATLLERPAEAPAPATFAAPTPRASAAQFAGPTSIAAWMVAAACSLMCAAAIFFGAQWIRPAIPESGERLPAAASPPHVDLPRRRSAEPAIASSPASEEVIAPDERGVVLIGFRFDFKLVLATHGDDQKWRPVAVGWAFRPDAILFPAEILERHASSSAVQNATTDTAIVACTSDQTLAILHSRSGEGAAARWATATLEGPLLAGC